MLVHDANRSRRSNVLFIERQEDEALREAQGWRGDRTSPLQERLVKIYVKSL
jgi:hypothetical protein